MQSHDPHAHDLRAFAAAATQATVPLLCDYVSIASISTRGELLDEGARATAQLLDDAGLAVDLWTDRGAPVVYARRPAPAGAPTVLFYGHYDVQPPEPLELWTSPPFEATLRDGAVYGRGVGDNKGQLLAHIAAVRALIENECLAVGVEFLVEGEEEIGSPNLAHVVGLHRDELRADLAITADAPVHDDGSPVVIFGVRGLLYVELSARGAPRDLHSGNRGGIAPTPAWELVHALASMRAANGTVTIGGFYDDVRAPSVRERQMIDALPLNRAALCAELDVERLPEAADRDPWETLMFRPAFNISGLHSGYSGPGAKTIVPHRAQCKIDVRLVADQQPATIIESMRRHLQSHAPGVELEPIASVPPSATDPDTPFAATVIDAVTQATGIKPWLRPRLGGTTPDFVFTQVIGIPSLLVPYGPPDMNHHAPDEKMTLVALERGIHCSMAICQHLARG